MLLGIKRVNISIRQCKQNGSLSSHQVRILQALKPLMNHLNILPLPSGSQLSWVLDASLVVHRADFEQNPINLDASVTTFNSGFSGTADIFTEVQSETANYGTSESTLSDPNWTSSHDWKGNNGSTGSSSTGPNGPQSGNDYIYYEASSNNGGTYH